MLIPERIGAHGLIFNKEGLILIVKRSDKDQYDPNTWDTPGGGIDKDTLEQGFQREVMEETSLTISDIKILGAYTIEEANLQILLTAKHEAGDVTLSFEHSEYKWVTLDELSEIETKGLHVKAAIKIIESNYPILKYREY